MKLLLSFVSLLAISLCSHAQEIHYNFIVDVVTGSKVGEVYRGSFTYDARQVDASLAEQRIEPLQFDFSYGKYHYSANGYSLADNSTKIKRLNARLVFKEGKFVSVEFVGGPQSERFGLNDGFKRHFVVSVFNPPLGENDSFFGYLDPRTFVDGFGRVTYIPSMQS